jgi:hypothetical protein
MKSIFLVILSITMACSLQAQQWANQRMGAVYVTVNGNKNLQVSIDGTVYNLSNTSSTVSKINAINGLVAGMHDLTITGTGNNSRRANNVITQFNLRRNFDMYINVNADGSLELIEKRKGYAATNNTPMSSTNFNNLMRNLRLQNTVDSRNRYLSTTFNTPNTYFTSLQTAQLLQQIRSESDRLPLAKSSFRTVTDPNNFSTVYGLFTVQSNRNDLLDYISNYDGNVIANNEGNTTGTTGTPMSSTSFNDLYQTIRGQYSSNTQVNSITNAFNTPGNYFTSTQASQLIQLINSESSRLYLAKLSYHTVIDPSNFSTVSNLLYTQASRDDLSVFINGNGGTVITDNTRIAMSETDYNTLYQSVSAQFLPYAKMNYLTTTFNNESYFFTVAQAKNLIQMVTNESNRVQLAKAVYSNLVDRPNYTQFYDLFTLPASRTELNTYVQSYRD